MSLRAFFLFQQRAGVDEVGGAEADAADFAHDQPERQVGVTRQRREKQICFQCQRADAHRDHYSSPDAPSTKKVKPKQTGSHLTGRHGRLGNEYVETSAGLRQVIVAVAGIIFLFVMFRWFEQSQVYHPSRQLETGGDALRRPFEDVLFKAAWRRAAWLVFPGRSRDTRSMKKE